MLAVAPGYAQSLPRYPTPDEQAQTEALNAQQASVPATTTVIVAANPTDPGYSAAIAQHNGKHARLARISRLSGILPQIVIKRPIRSLVLAHQASELLQLLIASIIPKQRRRTLQIGGVGVWAIRDLQRSVQSFRHRGLMTVVCERPSNVG